MKALLLAMVLTLLPAVGWADWYRPGNTTSLGCNSNEACYATNRIYDLDAGDATFEVTRVDTSQCSTVRFLIVNNGGTIAVSPMACGADQNATLQCEVLDTGYDGVAATGKVSLTLNGASTLRPTLAPSTWTC